MSDRHSKITLNTQIQAVSEQHASFAAKILREEFPGIRDWDFDVEDYETYKTYIKSFFTFTPEDLIDFYKKTPEICENILIVSSDKRYAPSTFISQYKNDQYRVGWVTIGKEPISQIRVFASYPAAVADYVLFSWGYPRLTSDQADWYEMDKY
jgi:hypothetical protein